MTAREVHFADSCLNKPEFLREIEDLSEESGLIAAVHETLDRNHITVKVEGDIEQLKDHSGGILFIGDHKNRWEFVALMDMVSSLDRDDLLHIAKFYVQRQVRLALGNRAAECIVPVYPRILARDRQEFFNSETLNRILYKKHLLTMTESAEANERALIAASDRLGETGSVNIYPTGSVVDARNHPWRVGVGRILQRLSEEEKKDVLLAPYSVDDISPLRLMGAVAMRGRSIFGRPQDMTLQLGPVQNAQAVVESLPPERCEDPVAITAKLQQQFIDYFSKT